MRFDDSAVDVTGVDDRRGGGLGGGAVAMGGGGLGVVGLIVYLVISVIGGGADQFGSVGGVPSSAAAGDTGETREELAERCNSDGAVDRYDDCYLIKVYNEVNEVWTDELARRGASYRQPGLVFFTQGVGTGCGTASSQVGPFYCPPDEQVFVDLGFLEQLQQQYGAEGRYAQAYVMAHEVGHHLQTLFGTERQVRAQQQRSPSSANALSVATELQADCYAGVWSTLADRRGNVAIDEADFAEATAAAEAVGDDRIQERVAGRVDPESWTHGSAEQRRSWFETGYRTGDLDACDTFS